ncbi:MAG: urea ABC transporter ATP-binding subunit UrtE [Actinobacteria bacterium]|nr:MAG: urea ABC transporter ATP-binding subunit UrtE [Actinomycetota bacterium]
MLTVDGIESGYGRTTVLFGVSMEVPDDALVCVMGRNGVGKTTLIKTVMGVIKASRGRITLDGREITGLRSDQRVKAGLAYVPQGRASFPSLSVRENLQVVIEASPNGVAAGQAALDEALDLFPKLRRLLARQAGFLSGGEAQQLAIARALVTRPRLLLLDEPTEGIQPSVIIEIENAIAQLNATNGLAIVLVEQYMEFALRLAQRYVVLDAGRVVAEGPTEGLANESVRKLLAV